MTAKANRASAGKARQILVVDDHPILREGLTRVIERTDGLAVCCEAGTVKEALAAVTVHKPNLVLTDLTLPDRSGLDLVKDLQFSHPKLPVLVVSMHEESLYAERAIRSGARGYIMKQSGSGELVQAIQQILGGGVYLSPKMSATILNDLHKKPARGGGSQLETLSDRELEVFELVGQGWGTKEIAQRLAISHKTVEVHRLRIRDKLSLKTTPEMVRFAIHWAHQRRENAQ